MRELQVEKSLKKYKNNNRGLLIWIVLGVVTFAALQLQFRLLERATGAYLVWQNDSRQKTGRRWAVETNQLLAGSRLETISQQIRKREKAFENLNSFRDALERLSNRPQEVLPAEHFIRIYNGLPGYLNALIVPPDSLIAYRVQGSLQNVVLQKRGDGIQLDLLSTENAVLIQRVLDAEELGMLLNHGTSEVLDIDASERFESGNIYEITRFQSILDELSFEMKQNFLNAMPALIEFAGPSTRIAISNKIVNEFIEVAVAADNLRAYLYYLPEDWIIDFLNAKDEKYEEADAYENFL